VLPVGDATDGLRDFGAFGVNAAWVCGHMKPVAIIGAGITALAAAFYLKHRDVPGHGL